MINKEQISRLLNYRNLLRQLKSMGFNKIFSDNLSDSLGISSSLVRKDFSDFKVTGNKKGGYVIDDILVRFDEVLGKNEKKKVLVIGVGRIGEALINYSGFPKEGIEIVAGFDLDHGKVDEKAEVPIYDLKKLEKFAKENEVQFAIMSVPVHAAKATFELLRKAGIIGILNFTPIKLKSTDSIKISNVHIVHEMENLIYRAKNMLEQED